MVQARGDFVEQQLNRGPELARLGHRGQRNRRRLGELEVVAEIAKLEPPGRLPCVRVRDVEMPGMRRQSPKRTVTEAERRAGQRESVLRGEEALADLRARLARRDGVAATIHRALVNQRCALVQTYWMLRWTGPTYHVILLTAAGADPVTVEMFLLEGTSELVLARSAEGRMTIRLRVLAEWLGSQDASCSAATIRPGA